MLIDRLPLVVSLSCCCIVGNVGLRFGNKAFHSVLLIQDSLKTNNLKQHKQNESTASLIQHILLPFPNLAFFCFVIVVVILLRVLVRLETQYVTNCFNKCNKLCKTSSGYSADFLSLARITEIQLVFNFYKNYHVIKFLSFTVSHGSDSKVCVHFMLYL